MPYIYASGAWVATVGGGAGTAYVAGGTDVAIVDGGTGVSTLPSGLLKGAGTGAITAATAGTDYYAPAGTDVAIVDGGTGVSTLPTGLLKGAGTGAITAATAGTDYLTPTGSAASLTSFPTLNQNTTGSAATLTTPRTINGVSFNGSANIQLVPNTTSAASNATPACDATKDGLVLTALAAAITAFSISGTFGMEQKFMIRIKDNGTARAITWTSTVIVPADNITLPTTTVVGKTHRIGCIYDEVIGKLVAWAVGTV